VFSLNWGLSVGKLEVGVKEKGEFMGIADSLSSGAVDVWNQRR
jgi:hypothetical protein